MEQELISEALKTELHGVILDAHAISKDVGHDVEMIVRKGMEQPLSHDEAARLLTSVIMTVRKNAIHRGDTKTAEALAGNNEEVVERMVQARERLLASKPKDRVRLQLIPYNDIPVSPVMPTPWFHSRKIPMYGGFVRTSDIKLWDENDRLQIHLDQFRRVNGRAPSSEELLELMLNHIELPGVKTNEDAFAIKELARSIANNGVRKAPIIDIDGTLLDGNRRLAACHYILNAPEFSAEHKRRVEYMYVWQLTEFATSDDRYAVVVSLNFEPDCKQDWPKYVKARKVYDEWVAMLAREPKAAGATRQQELKRELSQKFALGPKVDVVNRYIKMVKWADEFEEYLVADKERDAFEVKHRANEKFEYFDELSKGDKAGGVAYTLEQNEGYKHLVFDLLFEDKFRNWNLIRKLKYYDDDVHKQLTEARDEKEPDRAEDIVDRALTDAHNRQRESRVVGAEARIDTFVRWLEGLPPSAYQKEITANTLQRLLDAVKLVEVNVDFLRRRQGQDA